MSVKNYYESKDLYFSEVFGSGVYEWTGQNVNNPMIDEKESGCYSPLLVNKITGELYFLKRFCCDSIKKEYYTSKILTPPNRDTILWPSDMVELSEEQQKSCMSFLEQEYSAAPVPVSERNGNMALLFSYSEYSNMVNALQKYKKIPVRNWKNLDIRNMAIQILKAIDDLNKNGYVYSDIHFSRFFFKEDGSVFLNYTNLIYSFRECMSAERDIICAFEAGKYPIEFAEPAIVREICKGMDFHTQNYSIAAMLFYLFFGRYAYDGRLLTGYADDNLQKHYIKFRDYHKMPIFIFDTHNKENMLGAFDDEEQVVELWEECPEKLKELFLLTLSQNNAERKWEVYNPTPQTWLKCFSELGWM